MKSPISVSGVIVVGRPHPSESVAGDFTGLQNKPPATEASKLDLIAHFISS